VRVRRREEERGERGDMKDTMGNVEVSSTA
jgi:hypothetical protein